MPRQLTIRSDKAYEIAHRRAKATGRSVAAVVEEALERIENRPREDGPTQSTVSPNQDVRIAGTERDELDRLVAITRARHGRDIDIADALSIESGLADIPAERRDAVLSLALRAAALRAARPADVSSDDRELWDRHGLPR